ncbi:hypothetical protein, partial [Streptomyces sp. CHA3]|uniref:hypothetical protein n=1 Tax=Streptomyces sp. CHA3 TaxID=2841669 RepID=UPI002095B21F
MPSWSGLPPVQLAARAGGAGVADNAFGGTLPTWQNPSFTVTASPAVLNPLCRPPARSPHRHSKPACPSPDRM